MTVFYFKWEEFFGAWLEMHGQSILIVYDLYSREPDLEIRRLSPRLWAAPTFQVGKKKVKKLRKAPRFEPVSSKS